MIKEMKQPAVSVVTTTYNRFRLLPAAIKSVQKQTFVDWEMVIIDDCSTNNDGREVVVEMVRKDSRLRLKRLGLNAGMAGGRNEGIKIARGRYVTFLDDDDVYLSAKLKRQVDAAYANENSEGAPVVVCGGFREDLGTDTKWPFLVPHHDNFYHAFLKMTAVDVPGMLVRRDVFDEVGLFDKQMPRADDREMWLRISRRYPHFKIVDEPLYIVYSRQYNRKPPPKEMRERQVAADIIMNKHRKYYEKHPKLFSSQLQYEGTSYILRGYAGEGRKRLVRSIRKNPKNIKSYICLGISLGGSGVYRGVARIKALVTNGK